ncbi:hypothetical protein NliqN6_1890 [Naganishia liquefaciens]|uniref:FHA domain-containing protein n=1 Tax=Naganishia liquefaciens TaxID=104408 RepID=A0A8H3TRD0_9TREE|nr:hypothetical protein NliqN6_1890 [Naganishia liquefaciens]
MDVSDDPTSFENVVLHEKAGGLEVPSIVQDTGAKDGYDTLGLGEGHEPFTRTEAAQQEMEQFLLSAGVEVAEGDHGEHTHAGAQEELQLDMEVAGAPDHHDAMMEGILDLASHELHGADHLHLDLEKHHETATFDLHQIHEELNDATTLHAIHQDTADATAVQPDNSLPAEEMTNQASLNRTRFNSNMALSPKDRGLLSEEHMQEESIHTGVQIVNEEVLLNDVGLAPLGEGLPSTEAMAVVKTEPVSVEDQVQGQQFREAPQQSAPSATEMLKTPSSGNPPLPIDHALTEPITAFYKLQFLEPPPAQASGSHIDYRPKEAFSYYMQTLDVTIGRKINRLKKSVQDQPSQSRQSMDREIGHGASRVKLEQDGAAEQEVKVESSAVFQEHSILTKNNDGEDGPQEGKQSTPPDVPPAKEIAKPPIDDQLAQRNLADAMEQEHVKRTSMPRATEEGDEQTSIRIIKSESDHKVGSGRDGPNVDDTEERQVDVDLGALKSVSRLHARIGTSCLSYSYTLSQFYLDVLGRNGAWVDDVFKVRGSRVALGPYTKIQISTRTFYFILPPASIASYPIPLNHNALTGPNVESLGFGIAAPKVSSQPAVSDNENDLHHLFQRPATFNAFSTNREEWEDERMGLFGMGKGMGKNGTYGYRSKHRKGRKCRKCKLQESEHKAGEREDLDHSFSGSDNEQGNGEDSNDSVCSCSRCASEQEWFSSSADSGSEESSELSSVSDSDEEESDVDSSSDESDGGDEEEEKEKEVAQQTMISPAEATDVPIKDLSETKGTSAEDSIKQGNTVVADDKGIVPLSNETPEGRAQSDSVMAASDAESEEETLASKLKVAELLKPTSGSFPAPSQPSDDQSSQIQLDDSSHLPPTEADIQAVQDLIASTMTPANEQGMPLQTPQSGMPYDNSMFASLNSSHLPMAGEEPVPVPEVKLTKAEKSALAARIREAKAAARKEEQERKKAEKAAQREKEKAEKAKAKADAAAAKAAKKQKAEALEREKMLARMESMQQPQADALNMDVQELPTNVTGDPAHSGTSPYPSSVKSGVPRPTSSAQGPVRPGMPVVRPARPLPNGFRPVNPTGPNSIAAPGVRPLRPGPNGMPLRPGMPGVRPGMPFRPGPGSVPPLQAQNRPGMQTRPLQPGVRPVRPGPPIRPGSRPMLPSQRPPLQPHMNSGSFGETREASRGVSPDALSIHSQEGFSRSPSLDPYSQKRISPLLGIDGQPFIGPDPIKPDLTYATIIYRALANVDRGRGTLGQVCDWVANEWEWFKMNPESGWQNSIRHNLSLNKAFLKVPRVPEDDPESKGSVWILDPVHAPELVERERKTAEQKEARAKRDLSRGPDIAKSIKPRRPVEVGARRDSEDHARPSPSPAPGNPPANSVEAILGSLIPPLLVPLNRQLPLTLGTIPPHMKSVDIKIKHLLPEPPYVFDNNTIILNPLVFGRFSKQQLAQMQALPTKSAITVLRTYVLRWLQEKVKKLGPTSVPRLSNPATRPIAAGPGPRPSSGNSIARPGIAPRPQGIRPIPSQARPVAAGVRPTGARPGMVLRPSVNVALARPGAKPGAPTARPAPRPINGNVTGARPPTPALDPETLRKITQLAESAIKTNSAQSANAKVLLQYLKQVGSHVNIAIATQILGTGVIPPNAIPARVNQNAGTATLSPPIRPSDRSTSVTPRPNPTTVLGKRPVEASSVSVQDSADAKRQKV